VSNAAPTAHRSSTPSAFPATARFVDQEISPPQAPLRTESSSVVSNQIFRLAKIPSYSDLSARIGPSVHALSSQPVSAPVASVSASSTSVSASEKSPRALQQAADRDRRLAARSERIARTIPVPPPMLSSQEARAEIDRARSSERDALSQLAVFRQQLSQMPSPPARASDSRVPDPPTKPPAPANPPPTAVKAASLAVPPSAVPATSGAAAAPVASRAAAASTSDVLPSTALRTATGTTSRERGETPTKPVKTAATLQRRLLPRPRFPLWPAPPTCLISVASGIVLPRTSSVTTAPTRVKPPPTKRRRS